MSFEREEVESNVSAPEQELKPCQQNVTKCATTLLSPSQPSLDFECFIQSATDTSFEVTMHQDNMEHMKSASLRLMEDCLPGQFHSPQGFKDSSLYKFKSFEVKGDSDFQAIITHNYLLDRKSAKELQQMIEKEEGLIGLFKEAPRAFGLTVAKELVYVIYHLLREKYEPFQELVKSREPLIPKLPCFQDCCDDCLNIMGTSCPVYEEMTLEEVGEFAERDIELIANQIYFSNIRILNLKDIITEPKKGVNVVNKFAKFIKQVSRSVFLTIIGASEPFFGVTGLDFSRQISFAEFSEVNLSVQKSLSRPFVPYDQQQSYDFLSKKIKF